MADKVYKCLNPVGYQEPIKVHPLSPRLDKIDGKRIMFNIGAGGEQGILIALRKMLPERYLQVKWNIKFAAAHGTKAGSVAVTEEERATTDALIRGVVW